MITYSPPNGIANDDMQWWKALYGKLADWRTVPAYARWITKGEI